MKVLRIVNSITHASAPYHQFTLPLVDTQDITICAYFDSVLQPHPNLDYYQAEGRLGKFLKNLKGVLQKDDFDVVHVHHVQVGFLFIIVSLLFKPIMFSRSIITVHTSYNLLTVSQRFFLFCCFIFFRKIVACSLSSLDSIPVYLKRISNSRLMYITNGCNVDKIEDTVKHSRPMKNKTAPFEIIYVASLKPGKNHTVLLQAFKKWDCHRAVLRLIGGGSLLHRLEEEALALGCANRVIFTGVQPRDVVLKAMVSADLFISPSEGEGLPIAVIEAMVCGCPVVLSDIPPHREIVSDNKFVPLLPPHDVEGFVKAIHGLAAMPEKQIHEITQKVRAHAIKNFSMKNMLDNYLDVYQQIAT